MHTQNLLCIRAGSFVEAKFGFSHDVPVFSYACTPKWTGDWDCVAAVERLPALQNSVDFIFLSFGIMGFIVEL